MWYWYWPYAGVATLTLNYWEMQPEFNSRMMRKWIIRDLCVSTQRQREHLNFSDTDIYPNWQASSEFCPFSIPTKHHFCWNRLFFLAKLLRLKTWKFVMTQQKHFMWNKVPHKFKILKLLERTHFSSLPNCKTDIIVLRGKINLLAWEVARLWLCAVSREERRENWIIHRQSSKSPDTRLTANRIINATIIMNAGTEAENRKHFKT